MRKRETAGCVRLLISVSFVAVDMRHERSTCLLILESDAIANTTAKTGIGESDPSDNRTK
jgi:hypothetical protein